MSDDKQDEDLSPFSEEPTGGRWLLAAIGLGAVVLLAMLPWQTTPGSMGQAAMSGGWWAEPALAPGVALSLTAIASLGGFLVARRDRINIGETLAVYLQIALIAGCMIGAVMLMKILGFALSILIFAFVATFVGGFRGWRLAAIPLLTTVAMVLIFRVGFAIWFPRPRLYKWIDIPNWLQGIL